MNFEYKNCGCKGIRTCLFCESEKKSTPKSDHPNKEKVIYTYCPHCNLCWPEIDASNTNLCVPLYLGKIKIILDFLSPEEEALAVAEIDKMPWLPSQSGRKKQDFGPKVNFKKKKSKIGDFKGFPNFSKMCVDRFHKLDELSDFSPVELCHLDYSPDRGSAIEPHIDDFWIWGERLVTINLSSQTILTLTPANTQDCYCENHLLLHDFTSDGCDHQTLGLSQLDDQNKLTLKCDSGNVICMCRVYRTRDTNVTPSVRIKMPSKSLIVLSGCARYNWFHAIKREDINSRRLAMTFRELSSDFLINENEKKLGEELIEMGKRFSDFTIHS